MEEIEVVNLEASFPNKVTPEDDIVMNQIETPPSQLSIGMMINEISQIDEFNLENNRNETTENYQENFQCLSGNLSYTNTQQIHKEFSHKFVTLGV